MTFKIKLDTKQYAAVAVALAYMEAKFGEACPEYTETLLHITSEATV